jgi:SAM-dependent methyltransferase
MNIAQRSGRFVSSFFKIYGPSGFKKLLWDKEFSGDKWNFMDDTSSDCVYSHLETHIRGGDMLDLGCGPGNTANELNQSTYRTYVGVDISEAAVAKGLKRTEKNGRGDKNSFVCSDFLSYDPTRDFDLILFRESMYHIPFGQILPILDKYAKHLKKSGVFVVRLYAADIKTGKQKSRVTAKLDLIKSNFDIVESTEHNTPGLPTVLVFRPRKPSAKV